MKNFYQILEFKGRVVMASVFTFLQQGKIPNVTWLPILVTKNIAYPRQSRTSQSNTPVQYQYSSPIFQSNSPAQQSSPIFQSNISVQQSSPLFQSNGQSNIPVQQYSSPIGQFSIPVQQFSSVQSNIPVQQASSIFESNSSLQSSPIFKSHLSDWPIGLDWNIYWTGLLD